MAQQDQTDNQIAERKAADDSAAAGIAAKTEDFLKNYKPAAIPAGIDMLAGRWRIDLGKPLPQFDSKTARAYVATDIKNDTKKLFALVCEPATVQRFEAIEMYKGKQHPNLLVLEGAGVVPLSTNDQERYVLVYEQPQGKRLSELLESMPTQLNASFISKHMITPLIMAVGHLSELDISHGSINPDNVYYGDIPVLGDFLSEPCGYSQPFYFEPLDRMLATPAGRGDGTVGHDYYALAILTLYILYGKSQFSDLQPETFMRRVVRDGAYVALLRGKEPPELFNDFLRGLLSGNVNERWNHRNLKQWVEGKRSNIMLPVQPPEAQRAFDFVGTTAGTRRELAYLFATHWPQAQEEVRGERLNQWVLASLRDKDLSEQLKRIKSIVTQASVKNEIQVHEQIMRLILLFDSHGPIRIVNLAFNVDGLHSLCMELFRNKAQAELRLLSKFVEFSMVNYWIDQQEVDAENPLPKAAGAAIHKLDRMRLFIRNAGFGFGLERMLYEFNSEIACQSPFVLRWYANSLPALLKRLDEIASTHYKEHDPLDMHIAAFIGQRTGILHEVKLHELLAHPNLATHRSLVALKFISMAQAKCGELRLPGLCHWLAMRIFPALDTIRSRSLRLRIKAALLDRAQTGYSQRMAEVMLYSNYANADTDGNKRATQTYLQNENKIKLYKHEDFIHEESSRVGLRMAKFIASLIFLLALYHAWNL